MRGFAHVRTYSAWDLAAGKSMSSLRLIGGCPSWAQIG